MQGLLDKVGIDDFEHKFERAILKDLHEAFPELVSGIVGIWYSSQ